MILINTHTFTIERKHTPFKELPELNIPSFSSEPPIVYAIEHKTRYKYSGLISHSKHLFRLQPLNDISQMILYYKFWISSEGAEMSNFSGSFGNNASFIEIKEAYSELTILSQSIVSLSLLPKKMDLLHQPRMMPIIWMPWDQLMLQVYLHPPELPESQLFELSEYAMSFVRKNNNDIFNVLKDINETIFREYNYTEGVTTLTTTPYETYLDKQGVCQDFANLFICLARLLNIPARYRVGYLNTKRAYKNVTQADASHAWVEVFMPYVGWIGFDPTNGCMAEENHIRVACGRHYLDATPTSGSIFQVVGEGQIQETLDTSVKVTLLD